MAGSELLSLSLSSKRSRAEMAAISRHSSGSVEMVTLLGSDSN